MAVCCNVTYSIVTVVINFWLISNKRQARQTSGGMTVKFHET